jgi:hypothetical protein
LDDLETTASLTKTRSRRCLLHTIKALDTLFFDILGFSDRLRTMEITVLHHLYAELIDDVRVTVFTPEILGTPDKQRKSNFDRADLLFDSIVLVSRNLMGDGYGAAVHDFLMSCTSLMEKSFAQQLPIRGAIGFGDYLEDSTRNIFLSREFAHLVRAEKAQNWSGCLVLPEAAKQILPIVFLMPDAPTHYEHRAMPLVRYEVPFKSTDTPSSNTYWCINWVYFLDPSERAIGLAFLKTPKLENTLRFIQHIDSLPDEDRPLPENFRPAIRILGQGTRCGVRIKFLDASGHGVDPPADASLKIKLTAGSEQAVFQGPPITSPKGGV